MAIARKHPDYVDPEPKDGVGSRWNWFKSEIVSLPTGPVLAHRHPNGGGWVADSAYVSPSAIVEPTGFVSNNAVVIGDVEIKNYAAVFGEARVYGHSVIGEGNGFQKVYNKGQVFGNVTFLVGEGEVFSITRDDGRAFGEIIIMGGAGIIEGLGKGDVLGAYKALEDPEYLDVKYPNNPQAHSNVDPIRGREDLDMASGEHDIKWEPVKEALWADIHFKNARDGFSPTSF